MAATLRDRLVERQKELGYRDDAMAKAIGIPRTSYSSIKVGRYRVTLDVARKIARAFPDLTPYILADEPEPAEEGR